MADPKFKLCDICGDRTNYETRLYVTIGWSSCPAGGPSEKSQEIIDLCDKHLSSAVMVLLKDGKVENEESGKRLVEWVRNFKRKT